MAYTACWVAIVALGVALVFVPVNHDSLAVHLVGGLFAATGVVFLQRSLRWATIDVGPENIAVHDMLGTSKFAAASIERFLVVRNVDSSNHDARELALRTRKGETIVLADFSSDGVEGGFSVEALAARLNAAIGAATSRHQRADVA